MDLAYSGLTPFRDVGLETLVSTRLDSGRRCRDDSGSHFLTRDPRLTTTHESQVMTPDYCSFQSGPLSGSALKIKRHHCRKIACSWNLVNLIVGQRVTSTGP